MNNWKIVIAFTYPQEAYLAKAKLESEGIEVMLKDELSVQVHNFYSNAIGGVKLLVKEEVFQEAEEILISSGYASKTPVKHDYLKTQKRNFRFAKGIYLFAIIIATIAIGLVIFSIDKIPSTEEKLTRQDWCFNAMYYEDWEFTPLSNTGHEVGTFYFVNQFDCQRIIRFYPDGTVLLPGFSYRELNALWEYEDHILSIIPKNRDMSLVTDDKSKVLNNEEPNENVYYGQYKVEFDGAFLILETEKRILHARR